MRLHVYHYAKELKINVIYAGHYKTETVGIKTLMNKVKEQFPDLNTQFIDLPTGFLIEINPNFFPIDFLKLKKINKNQKNFFRSFAIFFILR